MTVQEVINNISNVKDKSEKIHKDINGNPISTEEMIKILRGIQRDNGEDEDEITHTLMKMNICHLVKLKI